MFGTSRSSSDVSRGPDPPLCFSRGDRLWVGGNNVPVKRFVERWLRSGSAAPSCTPSNQAGPVRPRNGPVDAALLVPASADEAAYFAEKIGVRLAVRGVIWVVQAPPSDARYPVHAPPAEGIMAALAGRGFTHTGRATLSDGYVALGFRRAPSLPGDGRRAAVGMACG